MRLESAFFSGREGLTVHGQAIAVISDNISNTNTTAFKESRIEFSDLLAEGPEGAGTSENLPSAGNGVYVTEVRTIFVGGPIEATDRPLDVAIDGEGFFLVGDPESPSYSRSGNFSINEEGNLVSADGATVLGFAPGATTLSALKFTGLDTSGAATSSATIVANLSAKEATQSGPPSNPASFNELNKTASFMSSLTIYDSLGDSHDIAMAFTKTGLNTWVAQAYINGTDVQGGTADVPVQVGANVTLTFGENGLIPDDGQATAQLPVSATYSNGAAAGSFTVNLAQLTGYASPSSLNAVSQNGSANGNIKGYEFQSDGQIFALLDTGSSKLVGTVQLADFANRDGLERSGSSIFRATTDAGDAITGSPGEGTLGFLRGESLERSTVDIATQFVNLVLYQRGYQANSQTLGAANQMLRDALGLVR